MPSQILPGDVWKRTVPLIITKNGALRSKIGESVRAKPLQHPGRKEIDSHLVQLGWSWDGLAILCPLLDLPPGPPPSSGGSAPTQAPILSLQNQGPLKTDLGGNFASSASTTPEACPSGFT